MSTIFFFFFFKYSINLCCSAYNQLLEKKEKKLESHRSRSVWQCPVQRADYCTEYSWGCNHCPGAIANMIAQYTEGENVKNAKGYCDATSFAQICATPCVHPLTLLWLETRQCSHTFTRCSKQNKLVTFLFGHLQRPMATCNLLRTNK